MIGMATIGDAGDSRSTDDERYVAITPSPPVQLGDIDLIGKVLEVDASMQEMRVKATVVKTKVLKVDASMQEMRVKATIVAKTKTIALDALSFISRPLRAALTGPRKAVERVKDLAGLVHSPDAAPTALARVVAQKVLVEAMSAGVVPDRLTSMSDGGVVMYFFPPATTADERRYASLECCEGGELVLLRSNRSAGMSEVEEIPPTTSRIRAALEKIARFLDPQWPGR